MNLRLKLLLYASVFGNFSSALLGPIYALFVQSIGGSIIVASTSFAVYTIVFALSTTFIGKLEDSRFKKEKMVFIGYFLLTIGNLLFIFVQKAADLYLLQALMGVGVAITSIELNTFALLTLKAIQLNRISSGVGLFNIIVNPWVVLLVTRY